MCEACPHRVKLRPDATKSKSSIPHFVRDDTCEAYPHRVKAAPGVPSGQHARLDRNMRSCVLSEIACETSNFTYFGWLSWPAAAIRLLYSWYSRGLQMNSSKSSFGTR